MKALTLTQPWATLVAIGAKRIETRSWSTNYRGSLAIHAAKTFTKKERSICLDSPFYEVLSKALRKNAIELAFQVVPDILPLGCVIATCELVGVDMFGPWINRPAGRWINGGHYMGHHFELTEQERAFGDFRPGRYGWFLTNVKMLPEPIPAKGMLGLWEWDEVPAR
jgi:hypothetical protein